MSLMRSSGLERANISPQVTGRDTVTKSWGFSPKWTAGASKSEAYPNLQSALTHPIDWQLIRSHALGHGGGPRRS
jgi:hypothetical protein